MQTLYWLVAVVLLYLPGDPVLPWRWQTWLSDRLTDDILVHAEVHAIQRLWWRPGRDKSPVADLDHETPPLTPWQRYRFIIQLRGRRLGQWTWDDPIRWETNP